MTVKNALEHKVTFKISAISASWSVWRCSGVQGQIARDILAQPFPTRYLLGFDDGAETFIAKLMESGEQSIQNMGRKLMLHAIIVERPWHSNQRECFQFLSFFTACYRSISAASSPRTLSHLP